VAFLSLALAEILSSIDPAANFFLLPSRAWELLLGSLIAVYREPIMKFDGFKRFYGSASAVGLLLILFSIYNYDSSTPFPGLFALAPTIGASLIIMFASSETLIGRLLSLRPTVFLGLISYSAYLWHQPLLAFARQRSFTKLSNFEIFLIVLLTFFLAICTRKYIELPFRNRDRISRHQILIFSVVGSVMFFTVGGIGVFSDGFSERFNTQVLPKPWTDIKCHGGAAVAKLADPLNDCPGIKSNGKSGDISLLGDSHAAQLTFPLQVLAKERGRNLYFINTENPDDFPYSFFSGIQKQSDRILNHVSKVADRGDQVVIAFHRGRMNSSRDEHIPIRTAVLPNSRFQSFVKNMNSYLFRGSQSGVMVYLVKDNPMLPYLSNLERCNYSSDRRTRESCSMSRAIDTHTRSRQEHAFDLLSSKFTHFVRTLDLFIPLYGTSEKFDPIFPNGRYKMFDQHHLTKEGSLALLPFLRQKLGH
jgi:hypothetical protein